MTKQRSVNDLKILDGYSDFNHIDDPKKRELLEQIFAKIGRIAREWKDAACPISEPDPPPGLYLLITQATSDEMTEIRQRPDVKAWLTARCNALREREEWQRMQPDFHGIIFNLATILVALADGKLSTDKALIELLAMDYY
jgi:hypothetical protein